jgi:hypothetical protein
VNRLSIEPFFDRLKDWLEEHRIPDSPAGSYVRRTLDAGKRRVDAYSPADVADICYAIGALPLDGTSRDEWIGVLRSFQDPATGLWGGGDHHIDHTTAYAIAALELFDARPEHPLKAYDGLKRPGALEQWLESLDWEGGPWQVGHRGAGVASSFAITGEADKDWFDRYFAWLDAEHDPATGFLRKGVANKRVPSHHPDDIAPILPAMAGTFHFHFVYHHFRHPFPYPEAMIDNTLMLQQEDGAFYSPGGFGFPELDAVFSLGRAVRQCGYRFGEVMASLEKLAVSAVSWVNDADWMGRQRGQLDDTHWMAGVVFCLAELQTLVPGLIDSPVPMRNVLDRRPFV